MRKALRERRGVRGRVSYYLVDAKTRAVLQKGKHHNIITRTGLGRMDTALFSAAASLVDTCKVGTGTTAPADTDTALTSLLETKDIGSVDTSNVSGSTPYTILRTQFDESEAIGNITEMGLFFDDGGMFNHALFGRGTITGATQADPVVITSADHGLTSGQRVIIASVGGMTQLNGNRYYVSVLSSSTFSLYNDAALSDTVDGSGFSAYTSGGTWTVDIPKTSSTILVVRVEVQLANA